MFHLRRTCGVTETYRETSPRRRHDVLMPGGLASAANKDDKAEKDVAFENNAPFRSCI